jgi:DNA-directed RNA polymerase II subunit RPB2
MTSLVKNQTLIPSSEDIYKLIDLYFNEKFILYNFQWNAFNQFINNTIRNDIMNIEHIIHEDHYGGKIYRYKIIFENVSIKPPVDDNANDEEIIFPEDCRTRFLTYASKLIADISQVQEIIDCETSGLNTDINTTTNSEINTDSNTTNTTNTKPKIITEQGYERILIAKEYKVPIAKIPIMVRSEYCSTNLKKDRPNTECRFDPGCYFIIKGSEKVVIGLERICENKMLCFTKKDPNYINGIMYQCQVNSRNMNHEIVDGTLSNIQIVSVRMKKDNSIILNMTQFADIPIFIIFRALNIVTDNDIINHIITNPNDTDMLNMLKISMNKSLSENIKDANGNYIEIKDAESAYTYLMSKIKNKRYSNTNIETNYKQRQKHLELILSRDFLPHMGITIDRVDHKARYLGKMINKLLNTYLGRQEIDDRDSFINKRIDLPGTLMAQLFRQYFKKMLNDCGKYFKKKNNGNHINPIDVIKFIKFTTIEQGLSSALLTGTWGSSKRKGVAQMLQRLTYKQFISYFRRIMPPPVDATNSKVTSMRHVNNIQYGFIDLVETPDGHKVGLHKHLSLMCTITMNADQTQINNIRQILKTLKDANSKLYINEICTVPLNILSKQVQINLNGEWLGITNNPFELVRELKIKRRNSEINLQVSINFNIKHKSIDIYTDAGRLIRPLLKVENNELNLTNQMLNSIDTSYINKTKITRWAEFIQKYPDVIEYVDVEESENLMIAMYPSEVNDAKQKMHKSEYPTEGGRGNPINRYDKVYVKYTHCEFHPMMFMGIISSNIPFSEHNQAPRNYFNFAQTRQGMGIYASNHRHRVDLSYLLYHPMRPLVITRAAKYTHELDIPAGENMIVAIACYTGYNQEDSIVMNRTSMQRGMAVSTTLKKYSDTITKNTSSGQDDIFMKPDRNKVTGMMDSNYYNKLNEKGYVPEETVITNGDVIIGKVAPIQSGSNTNKLYKDESEIYKSTVAGTVDKVYTGLYNADGYEMYNMRIRSERMPMIGDKLCSRHGQKGTIGILLPSTDMPFTESGIQPDIIINPCCFVGRTKISMTNGQSKRIDSFCEQGLEKLLTFNDNNNGFTNSFSLGMESKGIKPTIKITLYDGREIICTPDHKFKVKINNEYIYKEAKDLIIMENNLSDDLIIGPEYTENIYNDDEKLWNLNINKYNFNMLDEINREKTLAFARLLGYLHADGSLTKDKHDKTSYIIRLFIDNLIDVNSILNDIELITNIRCKIFIDNQNIYFINIPNNLGKEIANLEGMTIGYRIIQEASLPVFLLDKKLPKSFTREFLGGYFGGDGHSPYLMKNKFQTVHLSQSICEEFTDSLVIKMNNIIKLMNNIGINATINRIKKTKNNSRILVEIATKSNLDFLNLIGFRYCIQKSVKLSIAASYERLCNSVRKQHDNIINIINKKIEYECLHGNTIYKNGSKFNINVILEEARLECYQIDKPINQYYSLLTTDLIHNRRRLNKPDKLTHFNYKYFQSAKEYLSSIGCNNWFTKNDGKINYIIKKGNDFIPYWNMKILNIQEHKSMEVFDIGVAKEHNFLAEGINVSNCIPSRMTIGQLFECVFSKVAALRGEMIDATPFNNLDFTKITDELKSYGFNEHGYEHLYCGMTGKKILSKIFIGPTFYLRLKHMVQDKIHCLTLDHQINTIDGWKSFNELSKGDIIQTYNILNNENEYQPIKELIHYSSYTGLIYEIQKLGQKVTEDHRMLISEDGINYYLEKIQVINYPIYFKTNNDFILINESDIKITTETNIEVFCLSVENENFLVKRNGCVSWTGNSRATGPRQRLTRQPPEGKRVGCLYFNCLYFNCLYYIGCYIL